MKHFRIVLLITAALITSTTHAMDLPLFYRASLFQGLPKTDHRDGTTNLMVKYHEGSGRHAWDTHEKSQCLFNAHCPFELTKLGINLEGLTAATKPLTHQFLRGITRDNAGTITDSGSFTRLGFDEATGLEEKTTGQFRFGGHLSLNEWTFEAHQNLFWGFYLHGHLPYREIKLDCINMKHVGTEPTTTEQAVFDDFVANLDDILAENGIRPIKTCFKKDHVGDIVISAGWQGYDNTSFDEIISSLQGYMQIGLLVPSGSRAPRDIVFSLPTGYNHHWGITSRAGAQANVFSWLGIGVHGGVSIFFNETHCMRLKTTEEQNGWILLETARATTDEGTVWDIGGYLKADHIIGGLSALVGYHYSNQECTRIIVKDDNYLKTFVADSAAKTPREVVNRDCIASSDKRLDGWNQHVIHLVAEYDFGTHFDGVFAPQVQASYAVPVTGQYSWDVEMYGGSLNLVISWMV